MSQARYYEPNAGPLKLEHDTPMTSMRLNAQQLKWNPPHTILAHRTPIYYHGDFRYKGYPGQSFLSPRIPVSQLLPETKDNANYADDDYNGIGSSDGATPRDYRANPIIARPAPVLIRSDARYKGYPGNSFHSPRYPVSQSPEAVAVNSPRDFFGKITLFEPGRPKLDEGHRGLQYGSQNIHVPPPAPKPTQLPASLRAVPFGEDKTPAEIEKRLELQREAEQDIRRYKEEQARKKEREMEEKRKDYDRLQHHFMLDRYKYGHGASRGDGDHKRKKFTEADTAHQTSPQYRDPTTTHPDFFLDEFSKRRNGPSNNFNPGNHTLRGEGIIRFQEEGRKSIENRFRYNKPQQEKEELRKDLERQQEDRELRDKKDRIRELREELEMMKAASHNQSGGGAPNRSTSEEQSRIAQEPPKKLELKSLELDRTQGGAGAPVLDSAGGTITRLPITMKRDDMGVASIKENIPGRPRRWEPESDDYQMFGKPGAGAPVRDSEGRIITAVYGKLGGELSSADRRRRTRAARLLKDDLQKEMEEQRRNREDMDNHMKAPIGELAEIMQMGRVGRPSRDPVTGNLRNQHLGNSDVSKLRMNKPEDTNKTEMKEYYDFLTKQAQERERAKQLNKLRENQEWRQHNDASDMMFSKGKKGGGAPKGQNLKKEKLSNTLFSPRHDDKSMDGKAVSDLTQAPDWMQRSPREPPPVSVRQVQVTIDKPYQSDRNEDYSSSNVGQRYVKSTIQSSNRNMYEMPTGPANPYSTQAPYAIGNY